MIQALIHDLRTAVAALAGSRWSSLSAVGTLALGVGACLAAGVLAYAGLVRPLPVPAEHQLVVLDQVYDATGVRSGVRWTQFPSWRDRLAGVAALAAAARERSTVRVPGRDPAQVRVAYVSDEWFSVLGVAPRRGRLPSAADPPDVAVVSEGFATRGDQSIAVAGRTYDVIGVVPASYAAVDGQDVWLLARNAPPLALTGGADTRDYDLVARLEPGATMATLHAAATTVMHDLVPEGQKATWHMEGTGFRDQLVGDARPVLRALTLAAVLILGLTCANVGLILVNRVLTRQREHAVRLALGAEPRRLVRVAVLEGGVLAMAGTMAGGWMAWALTGVVATVDGIGLPPVTSSAVSSAVAVGAAALSVLVTAACSAAPLLALRQLPVATTLRPRAAIGSRSGASLRGILVATQVATAVVLVTGALLLGRTVLALSNADLGLTATAGTLTAAVPIGESTGRDEDRLAAVARMLDGVRALPGVTAAGLGAALPPRETGVVFTIRVASDTTTATRAFDLVPVTTGYLDALGVRLLSGRLLTEADMAGPPVAVMSVSAVRHLALVLDTALGRELPLMLPTAKGPRVKARIVGIIDDVRFAGLDADARGGIYLPWTQLPLRRAFVAARFAGTSPPVAAMARIVRDADPSMPAAPVQTLEAVLDDALIARTARFGTVALFAVVAVVLATMALVGAMVRSVVERQRELAVRAAVGATPRSLLLSTWRRGLRVAGAGIAVGVAASVGFARVAAALLWGVSPTDPSTYAIAAGAALVLALTACYIPARRAAGADPMSLLTSE